jgi:WD40 repeat protein
MEANELRRAIELPAQQNSWDFEPGLVDLLLRDVGASEDHPPEPGALPLLEHALLETWKRRSGRTLTHQGYVDAGGVHGAIAKTAESVFTRLTLEQQALARRIFLRLTELGEGTQDTRRRAPLVELSLQPEDASQVESLLKILADARLITLSEDTAEVAHEALIREWPALRQWLSEDRDGLRLHRHLMDSAEAWAELDRDAGELYRGARLAQAAEWAESHPDELNALEREFLQVSQSQAEQDAAEREAQRQHELEVAKQVAESARRLARTQRQRSLVLSLGLAIAVVLIGVALWLNSRANTSLRQAQDAQQTAQSEAYNRATQEAIANQQAQIAVSRQLVAQSLSLQKEEYPLALLLAVEASSTADTVQAQGNLLSSLNYNPRLQVSFQSQTNEVTSLAFSPDGKTLAVGNRDTTITLWDFSNPAAPIPLGQPLLGHVHHVTSVVFSPDGKMLASSSSDSTGDIGSIRLWDLSNPAVPSAFGQPLPASVEPGIGKLVFSQDGKILVAGRFYGEITLWDISSPAAPITLVRKYSLSAGNINSIAISPDGKTLAAGCSDATIRFLDLSDPAAPIPMGDPLMQHTKEVASVVFSPDGKTLASGSYDHTVILWDLSNPAQPVPYGPPLAGHTDLVASIAFSPDGKTLASGSYDKTVILWDVSNPARPVLFDKPLKGHAGQVNSVTFSPDGKWLASGGCGQYSYFTCGQGQIILWDASRSKVLSRLGQPLAGHTDKVTGVVFNPNGKMLASGSADHTIRLWDVSSSATPVLLGQPLSGQVGISSIASSPDGQVLASGSDDATICLWDVSHPAAPILLGPAFSGHTDKVTSLVFSPDGKMLASGSNDATVILWDVSDPAAPLQLAPPLTGHFWFITSLAFSPDGKTLASGSYDSTIILWDVSKPDAPVLLGKPLTGHGMPVYSLAFSPDGKILASGGGDRSANLGSILMWDVSTPAAPVLLGQLLTGLSSPVYSLAFRPDGKQLATGNGDATIILWYVSDPAALVPLAQPLIGHTGEVWSLAYSPDGRRLVSGGSDGSLFLWEVSVDAWKNITCRIAGRNMTQAEWRQYLTGLPYHKTCAQWEEGK